MELLVEKSGYSTALEPMATQNAAVKQKAQMELQKQEKLKLLAKRI